VTLARNSEEVPTNLLAAIFRAPRPEGGRSVFDGLALPDGSFGVFRLEQVTPARPEDIPREQRDTRKSVLARQAGVAEVTALAVDLRKEAKVIVAPDLFEQQDGL
jgi:peptidyl-prolyl cis-trans isomerase D